MRPSSVRSLAEQDPEMFRSLRENSGWYIALGVLMGLLGIVAAGLAILTTGIVMLIVGWFLVLDGLLEIAHAFTARRWRGFFLRLLIGVFHVVFGAVIIAKPYVAAEVFTLIIAFFWIFTGMLRLVYAVQPNQFNRLPLAVGGIIGVLLGAVVIYKWPLSGEWVPGLFVGFELIIHASWLITMGLIVRELPEELPDSTQQSGHAAPG